MGRLANSWSVFKQSFDVLKKDKELLFLPVLSGIASIIMIATFLFPAYFTGLLERAFIQDPADPNAQNIMYGLMFVLYLVLSFVTLFFQAALISGANERLGGGDPTVGSALRGAGGRLGKIFLWSLFAATVSLLIQALESALRRGGNNLAARIITGILGTAWTLLTYFVIPVVLFENKGPFAALSRSGSLFKQRWGESLVGEWGIGLAIGVLTWLGVLVGFGLGGYLIYTGLTTIGFVFVGLAIFWIIFMAIFGQALAGIYKAALYRYAKNGEVVPYFTPQAIQGAYHPTYVSREKL